MARFQSSVQFFVSAAAFAVSFLTSRPALAAPAPSAVALFNEQVLGAPGDLQAQGYEKWQWLRSTCDNCEIALAAKSPELDSAKVQAFMRALSDNKSELQSIYGIHGAEYTLLAHMAVGILGRESKFFQSARYQLKEEFPWAVYFGKVMRSYATGAKIDPNSRGPTQIKSIPTKIAEFYHFTSDELDVPENAAVATMGFLIEALAELKSRAASHRLAFITPATYVDYLPYIYFGATKSLVAGKARPESNAYVQNMKTYMEWVDVYERAPQTGVR